jgi:hypothetical protein
MQSTGTRRPRNVAIEQDLSRLESIEQDLSRLVPGSVITLDDWELDSKNDDDVDGDDYAARLAALLAALAALRS